jgi:MFS family permease
MKEEQEYIRDIAEIRSMMERSTKFLSLSGWAGIMAGIYALAGAYIAYAVFDFHPDAIDYRAGNGGSSLLNVIFLAVSILLLAIGTAISLSSKNANKKGEKVWNATSRRLLGSMAVPLVAGGLLALIFIAKDLVGLVAPTTLIFYGLALFSASKFTYEDVKYLGLIQVALGIFGAYFIPWSLLLWALGFGLVHIGYGIYIHNKYER